MCTLMHSYGTCHFTGAIYTLFQGRNWDFFLAVLNCLNMTEGNIHLTQCLNLTVDIFEHPTLFPPSWWVGDWELQDMVCLIEFVHG